MLLKPFITSRVFNFRLLYTINKVVVMKYNCGMNVSSLRNKTLNFGFPRVSIEIRRGADIKSTLLYELKFRRKV